MLESMLTDMTTLFASGEKTLKPKYIRKKADSDTSPKQKPVQATKGIRLKSKAKVVKPNKKKQPAKKTKSKGLAVLSEVALTEVEQLKHATQKSSGIDKGTGTIPGVPDVPIYESESEDDYDGNKGNDGDDDDANDDDKQEALIKEEVNTQLPQILPQAVSDFANPVIEKNVTESVEAAVLTRWRRKSHMIKLTTKKLYDAVEFIALEQRSSSEFFWSKEKKFIAPKGPKAKESQSGSTKGDKSQSKSSGKSVQSEEPEFEVADSHMPQDQEENTSNDDEEPKEKVGSKHDWFTKPIKPQEPTDPDWNVSKTPQLGQSQSCLKINNLTQETMLGPTFRLLKGTRSNYAELEYDFEEFMSGNCQKVLVDYFFNNDLKYLQGGVSTMTYMTSITKAKAVQYDLSGIEDMVLNIWVPVKVAYDKHALWGISH
ncbi:hypothetical protein Tco_1347006 [Tanacetum coccineum]